MPWDLGPWAQKVPFMSVEAPEVFCRECWRQYLEQAVQEGRGTFWLTDLTVFWVPRFEKNTLN